LHVLYGSADLIIFDKFKKIKKKIALGTYNSGKIFYYRIKKKVVHSLDIKSKYFIFHEVTLGPFVKKHTIYK